MEKLLQILSSGFGKQGWMKKAMYWVPCKEWKNSREGINLQRRDYHFCEWQQGQRLTVWLGCGFAVLFLCYFFYRSFWGVLLLGPVAVYLFRREENRRARKQREELQTQFAECVLCVATLLRAGASAENAFLESEADMLAVFGERAIIVRELRFFKRGMQINITLEELLRDLGERSDCEEIQEFAAVFEIGKRSGGNLAEIIGQTAELLHEKTETVRELAAVIGGKRMELLIMEAMPFAMLFYIGLANPGYFDLLYNGWTGRVIMTGCLVVYGAAFALGDRILGHLEKRLE